MRLQSSRTGCREKRGFGTCSCILKFQDISDHFKTILTLGLARKIIFPSCHSFPVLHSEVYWTVVQALEQRVGSLEALCRAGTCQWSQVPIDQIHQVEEKDVE